MKLKLNYVLLLLIMGTTLTIQEEAKGGIRGAIKSITQIKVPKSIEENLCGRIIIAQDDPRSLNCHSNFIKDIKKETLAQTQIHGRYAIDNGPSKYLYRVTTNMRETKQHNTLISFNLSPKNWFGIKPILNTLSGNAQKNGRSVRTPDSIVTIHIPSRQIGPLSNDVNKILDEWFLRRIRLILQDMMEKKLRRVEQSGNDWKDEGYKRKVDPTLQSLITQFFHYDRRNTNIKINELLTFPGLAHEIKNNPKYQDLRPIYCRHKVQQYFDTTIDTTLTATSVGIMLGGMAASAGLIASPVSFMSAPTLALAIGLPIGIYQSLRIFTRPPTWMEQSKYTQDLMYLNKHYMKRLPLHQSQKGAVSPEALKKMAIFDNGYWSDRWNGYIKNWVYGLMRARFLGNALIDNNVDVADGLVDAL